jgi:hypothetical protein
MLPELSVNSPVPPSLKSFRIFKLEVARLFKLYDNALYAFKVARDAIYSDIHSGRIGHNDAFEFESFEGRKFKIGHAQNTAHNYRLQHVRYLRELIFIRLISALEVFLIDAIREGFLENAKVLKPSPDAVVQISLGEFLSYSSLKEGLKTYINRETRSLQGQGYDAIRKYYLKSLEIDFSRSKSDLSIVARCHDDRHILVHSLGRVDDQYRHKYSTDIKALNLSETDLLNAQREIFALALHVNDSLSCRIRQR